MQRRQSAHKPARPRLAVDRDKLRAAVRGLDRHQLLEVLDRALAVVP